MYDESIIEEEITLPNFYVQLPYVISANCAMGSLIFEINEELYPYGLRLNWNFKVHRGGRTRYYHRCTIISTHRDISPKTTNSFVVIDWNEMTIGTTTRCVYFHMLWRRWEALRKDISFIISEMENG